MPELDAYTAQNTNAHAAVVEFESLARGVLGQLVDAAKLLVDTAPTPIARAVDLQRSLGVQASLGWLLFRLARANEPLACVPYIPGPGLMSKVVRSARQHGYRPEAIAKVEAAYLEFQHFVAEHGGDRGTFDTMMASFASSRTQVSAEAADQIQLKDRRSNFKTCARLWGVQAKVWYTATCYHPTEVPGRMHGLGITGCVELRRSRPGPPMTFQKSVTIRMRKEFAGVVSNEIFAHQPVRFVESFCSKPLPRFERQSDANGVRDVLLLDGIGRTSRVNCFAYNLTEDNETTPRDPHYCWSAMTRVRIPCELYIQDLFLPHGMADPSTFRVATLGDASDLDAVRDSSGTCEMPFREEGRYLGTDLDELDDAALPKCSRLIERVLRKVGWDEMEFDLFRCRARFPVWQSAIRTTVFDSPASAEAKLREEKKLGLDDAGA